MVLFGVERLRPPFDKATTNTVIQPCLVIITNEITNELLKSIDTKTTKNIIFTVPSTDISNHTMCDITFDFTADIFVWASFALNVEHLEFRGKLVKKQLTVRHFESMLSIRSLYIGSTDYALFDNEDVSKLPMIPYVSLNGYGLVIGSENMEKWLEKLKLNRCTYERCY
jgi:hypothetical protein